MESRLWQEPHYIKAISLDVKLHPKELQNITFKTGLIPKAICRGEIFDSLSYETYKADLNHIQSYGKRATIAFDKEAQELVDLFVGIKTTELDYTLAVRDIEIMQLREKVAMPIWQIILKRLKEWW